MQGIIKNYRGSGKGTQHPTQFIVVLANIRSRAKASKLVGKSAKWTSASGKNMPGKVLGVHGNGGAVRIKFRIGLPGTALGTPVEIAE